MKHPKKKKNLIAKKYAGIHREIARILASKKMMYKNKNSEMGDMTFSQDFPFPKETFLTIYDPLESL